ncbi:hypothetical protein N5C55_15200 [Pseudomonas otitidis]|uniref:hypothetical protein n=1 Tax=Metapseudomonas otitidis TaxID=319939 RepID=UPI002446C5CA|nr:hypothetical protein [Pseudomonas otitidis]MDH1109377.1 hypothetical protein [Pseudomonas otitidis]MDH1159521.1 hypothetical protein [Pseudomonas otitidis]MDH1166664.1 hypothetical protein [Pseudomonas otitidis]
MRIVLLAAAAVALIPVAACAEELIGGGLKVVSVELLAESQAVIELDNGRSSTEVLWVDCALGEWGYNGEEAGFPVKPDEKSQAIAFRTCKDASNTSPLVRQPGSWR